MEIDEDLYRRERDEAEVESSASALPEEPDVVTAGQFLENLTNVWTQASPK